MPKEKNLMFVWKNFIFITYLDRSKLFLKWRSTDPLLSSNGKDAGKHGSDAEICLSQNEDDGSQSDTNTIKNVTESHKNNITSLNLDRWKHSEVVEVGFSFDQFYIRRVPVLLIQCGNGGESDKVEYIFIQVKTIPQRLTDSNYAQTSQVDEKCIYTSSEFTLLPIRWYSLNPGSDFPTSPQRLPLFLSSLQILTVNPDPSSVSIRLFTQDTFSSRNRIKDFDFSGGCKSISDIQILDSFIVQEDRAVIAIVSFKTDEGLDKCTCLKFSPTVAIESHSATESYDMVQLPLDILFASDFVEILKVVNISSFVCKYNLISKSHSFCTSIVMVTHTGYALKFNDGILCCCVSLFEHRSTQGWNQEDWGNARVKMIHFEGCPDKTALQMNSTCHLIDWNKEKVLRSWQSVHTAVTSDVHSCGISNLVLIFEPENTHFSDTLNSHQLLEEVEVRVVDDSDECESDDEEGNKADSCVPGHTNDDSGIPPLCAVNALQSHQKKCEDGVMEMKSELQSKLSFLSATWQQLSNLHICEDSQPPLSVVVEGSLPTIRCKDGIRNGCPQPVKKYVELGTLWKRIVDSLLVVGIPVRNISESSLANIFLHMRPASACQTGIFQTTSKCRSEMSSNTAESEKIVQRNSGCFSFDQGLEFDRECLLLPGHSTVVTSTADISQALSATDFTFRVCLTYSVLDDDKCPPETITDVLSGILLPTSAASTAKPQLTLGLRTSSPASRTIDTERDVEEYCAGLTITSQELLNGACSVGAAINESDETLTAIDLLALDCIQEHTALIVQSVVSSVTSLSIKLSSHPSVQYVTWAEQFLFVTTGWLKYCRVCVTEQYSKYRARIKVFARSQAELLLFIKFLYSLVPADITITPEPSSNLSAVMHTGRAVLLDIDRNICALKEQIDNVPNVAPSSEECVPHDVSLSPKFHTRNPKAKPVSVESEMGRKSSVGDASSSKPTGSGGSVMKEREVFRRARKRFREIWGDDSPE